jgi:hypothetical protein
MSRSILDGSVVNGSTINVAADGKEIVMSVNRKEIARSLPTNLEEDVAETADSTGSKIQPSNMNEMQDMIRNMGK